MTKIRIQFLLLRSLAIFLPISAWVAVYVFIGSFTRLMGDDYCLAYYAHRLGPLRSVWYWYLTWHGGYSASLVDSFLVLIGAEWMGWVTPVVFTLWIAGVTFSISMLLPRHLGWFVRIFSSLSLSGALILLTIAWSPAALQSVFWWSGMRGYLMPIIFASYYPGLFLAFVRKERSFWQIFTWSLLSFGVLFFAGGFSETYTLEQFPFLSFFVLLGLLTRKIHPYEPSFRFLVAGMFGALLSLFIMALAPGNTNRQGNFLSPSDVQTLFSIAFKGYGLFIGYVINFPHVLAALAAMFLGAFGLGLDANGEEGERSSGWIIAAILFAGAAAPFACFLLFSYAMSEPLVARAVINPVYFLSSSLLYAGFLVGKIINVGKRQPWLRITNITLIGALFVLTNFAVWTNVASLFDLRQEPIEYAKHWDTSHAAIIQAKMAGMDVVFIPAVNNWLGVLEPTDNPKFYVNKCMSKYYGLQVLVEETSE